jgi:hypothetical protein
MSAIISISGGQVHPDDNRFADYRPLPGRADRQKISEQAMLIGAAARAITEQSDRGFALLSAERPTEDIVADASFSSWRGP